LLFHVELSVFALQLLQLLKLKIPAASLANGWAKKVEQRRDEHKPESYERQNSAGPLKYACISDLCWSNRKIEL
jgi:hypothetical protein